MNKMIKLIRSKSIIGQIDSLLKDPGNDIKINDLLRNYCSNSVLVIIGAKPRIGLPTEAYKVI